MHINDWNSGSENQHVSLKAVFVLLAVGLQKPNPKSKAKDHQDALSKRLALWKDGEISKLIREGRIIQSRIGKFKGSNHPDKAKVFAKLVLEGQINSALRFLSETSNGGVLTLTDDVMTQVKQKHPESQPAKLGSHFPSTSALPLKEQGFNLNKKEFRDAVKLRYDWPIDDIPSICVCGDIFTVDHAMICKRGGFVIMRHNELRDLEAELLNIVCNDVQVEPVLQDISGEQLNGGSNRAPDARLDIRARGFWECQRSAFFDVRVCHPNADSYKDLELRQVYKIHENEKKRLYARRVLEIEQGTFTPLVFTTTGGMGKECMRYHSRLAELLAIKKGEDYATTISWIRARTSFALLRSALTCLRGSRARKIMYDTKNIDFSIENAESAISQTF